MKDSDIKVGYDLIVQHNGSTKFMAACTPVTEKVTMVCSNCSSHTPHSFVIGCDDVKKKVRKHKTFKKAW